MNIKIFLSLFLFFTFTGCKLNLLQLNLNKQPNTQLLIKTNSNSKTVDYEILGELPVRLPTHSKDFTKVRGKLVWFDYQVGEKEVLDNLMRGYLSHRYLQIEDKDASTKIRLNLADFKIALHQIDESFIQRIWNLGSRLTTKVQLIASLQIEKEGRLFQKDFTIITEQPQLSHAHSDVPRMVERAVNEANNRLLLSIAGFLSEIDV